MSWLAYSLLATLTLGFSMVFYKLPSYKEHSPFISSIVTNFISTILILVSILCMKGTLRDGTHISWYGLAWGAVFSVGMVSYKTLISGRDAGVIFATISSIGNTVTIILGILLFSEAISLIQACGVGIILISVYFFQKKKGTFVFDRKAFLLGCLIIISSTTQKFIHKFGAMNNVAEQFMIYQFIGATLSGLTLAYIFDRKALITLTTPKKYLKGAFLISVFSVITNHALIIALSLAPLSKVYAIQPIYTLVAAVLAVLFFKETFTLKKLILIIVTIIGVLLMRIG